MRVPASTCAGYAGVPSHDEDRTSLAREGPDSDIDARDSMRRDRHHSLGPPLLTFLVIVASRGVQCARVSSPMGGDVVHGDVVRG
jgi:hypothetical protein